MLLNWKFHVHFKDLTVVFIWNSEIKKRTFGGRVFCYLYYLGPINTMIIQVNQTFNGFYTFFLIL